MALNNLALSYQAQNDARAMVIAERALKLAGDNPAILDTVGWIMVERADLARGVPLLKRAAALAPRAPDIRFHLASGLYKQGDKAQARKELEHALLSGIPFEQADQARALLKQL